jgi:TatD DNase family protein
MSSHATFARLVDTHCHLDWNKFDPDRDQVVQRAIEAGVTRMITIGVDIPSSQRAIELAEKYPAVYAAIGVHPNDCGDFSKNALNQVRSLARHAKVVAIGEIGLDYYWQKTAKDQQARAFEMQLDLAAEVQKPVIIHNREATADVMRMLSQRRNIGVLHSFFESIGVAQQAIGLGYSIGFTGPITFKKADREREVAQEVPIDRILIETDAPFLTPEPHRGKRNEPAYVKHVAEMIAQVKGLTFDEVARQTTLNAEKLFGLG